MMIKEITATKILSESKIYPYTINPYIGCQHNCTYCYARFMKRFTGHTELWGEFVDVKVNAPELLKKELVGKKPDMVWISGVCDPYQPAEATYGITRACLKILAAQQWPVTIQTKSPLILRDMDILKTFSHCTVGFSIATAADDVRQQFEPSAPAIPSRIAALTELHNHNLDTYAMIAPILPGAERLPDLLQGKINSVILDRMNYAYADWVYKKYHLEAYKTDAYFADMKSKLTKAFSDCGVRVLY